jgi:hypothetical protein
MCLQDQDIVQLLPPPFHPVDEQTFDAGYVTNVMLSMVGY